MGRKQESAPSAQRKCGNILKHHRKANIHSLIYHVLLGIVGYLESSTSSTSQGYFCATTATPDPGVTCEVLGLKLGVWVPYDPQDGLYLPWVSSDVGDRRGLVGTDSSAQLFFSTEQVEVACETWGVLVTHPWLPGSAHYLLPTPALCPACFCILFHCPHIHVIPPWPGFWSSCVLGVITGWFSWPLWKFLWLPVTLRQV